MDVTEGVILGHLSLHEGAGFGATCLDCQDGIAEGEGAVPVLGTASAYVLPDEVAVQVLGVRQRGSARGQRGRRRTGTARTKGCRFEGGRGPCGNPGLRLLNRDEVFAYLKERGGDFRAGYGRDLRSRLPGAAPAGGGLGGGGCRKGPSVP